MNQSQKGILWIGVLVVLVFLFTDQSFRNRIFGRGAAKPASASVPFTAAQVFSTTTTNHQIILDAFTGTPTSGGTVSSKPSTVTLA